MKMVMGFVVLKLFSILLMGALLITIFTVDLLEFGEEQSLHTGNLCTFFLSSYELS